MAKENRYDSVELIPLDFSYNENKNILLDGEPYYRTGSYNFLIDRLGNPYKRPGFNQSIGNTTYSGKIFRKFYKYRTLPTGVSTIYEYLLASVEDTATGLYSLQVFSGGTWTNVTSLRDVNASIRTHLITVSRGMAYVKSFPEASSSEKLGTVVLDGSSGSIVVRPWGLLGPDTPARILGDVTKLDGTLSASATTVVVDSTTGFPSPSGTLQVGYEQITYTGTTATTFTGCTRGANGTGGFVAEHADNTTVISRDWNASDHPIEVKIGWKYAYCYETITGQVSNRSEVEYNPDLMPSFTGPFRNLVPRITVQGNADTVNIPYINIYRTTDGGGAFYFLEQITNTGAGSITYIDDSFGTGPSSSTFNDPVPDTKLDTARFAPDLTENSPPPTVIPPSEVGVDTPDPQANAIVTHVGRIFFAIKNYLVYSAREELKDGIGEESFPSGTLRGNYFILNDDITGLISQNDFLYVFTSKNIYKMYGSTRADFQFRKLHDTGAIINTLSVTSHGERIGFLGSDGNVYLMENEQLDPIGRNFTEYLSYSSYLDTSVFFLRDLDYDLFIVAIHDRDNSSPIGPFDFSRIFIHDIKRSKEKGYSFWWPPWYVRCTAFYAQTNNPAGGDFNFYSANYNAAADKSIVVATNIPTIGASATSDYYIDDAGDTASEDPPVQLSLNFVRIPSGNLVNINNRPTRDTKLSRIFIYTPPGFLNSTYTNPLIPILEFDTGGTGCSMTASTYFGPPRIIYDNVVGNYYSIYTYPIDRWCYRVAMTLNYTGSKVFTIYGVAFEFFPGYTATG